MLPKRIDFYLLDQAEPQAKLQFACRLLEKAYAQQRRVFVQCVNQAQAEALDELLWTFKEDSFIPHHLQGEGPEPPPPIQIGYSMATEPSGYSDILLNLSNEIPTFYLNFQRVIEIVLEEETSKEISRQHYRQYREEKCVPQIHPINRV